MYMRKYLFIALLFALLTAILSTRFIFDFDRNKEPFTPFLRQQFRQKSRQLRLGLRDRGRRANNWVNRLIRKYGLGF